MQNGDNPKTTSIVSSTAKQNHSVMESATTNPASNPARTNAAVAPDNRTSEPPASVEELSTVELVKHITSEVGHLAQKQIELAKAELKADLKSEAMLVGGLSVAAVTGLCTVNLLLVTVVLALSTVLPGWVAGLIVSGATLLTTAVVAAIAWSKRVRSPMARTKRTLQEDVQWTRERLV
jgi:hypothetical protein